MGILDGDIGMGSGGCKCMAVLAFVVLITTISVLAASLRKLESTEYGLQYNTHAKTLIDPAKMGGLHMGPPGFRFVKFPSTFITVHLPPNESQKETCVSRDGLRVEFSVTFQYQIPKEWVGPATKKYRNFDKWSQVVVAAGNSAVQHSCADFNTANFQNQRGAIQSKMEDNLRLKLEGRNEDGSDGVYARAISLQLREVHLPDEYSTAVAEKQSAEESIALAINQRVQEMTKAKTQLLAANEEAKKINQTAVNDAFLTLNEASIKANETIIAFQKEAEIIQNVKAGLNLTIDGVLSFLYNKLLEDVKKLRISSAEPAKLSRKDEITSQQ